MTLKADKPHEATPQEAQGHSTRTQKQSCMHITIHTTQRQPATTAEVTQTFYTVSSQGPECALFWLKIQSERRLTRKPLIPH